MSEHPFDPAQTIKTMRPMVPAKDFQTSRRFYCDPGFQRRKRENPDDAESEAAARLLRKLADGLRGLAGPAAYTENRAICGRVVERPVLGALAVLAT